MRLFHDVPYRGRTSYIITREGADITEKFEKMEHTPLRDWIVKAVEEEIERALATRDLDEPDMDWDVLDLGSTVEEFFGFDFEGAGRAEPESYQFWEDIRFYRDARAEVTWPAPVD